MCPIKRYLKRVFPAALLLLVVLPYSSLKGQPQTPYKADTFSVIYNWIAQVDTALVFSHIRHLQDYQTRDCFTSNAVEAQNWLKAQYEALGLAVELQDFPLYNDNPSDNVIATLSGKIYPNEYVVLGGHYDSWASSDFAPGADDNASGTSGVLEVARILSQQKFKRSIIFCAFSAEEYGLAGSDVFVGRCQQQGKNLLGYINMDMIAYHEEGTTMHSDMINPPGAQSLADFYMSVAGIYRPDFIFDQVAVDEGNSDHAPFNNWGYQGIFPFEDDELCSPFIHTTGDIAGPSTNSPELARNLIQCGLAAVATLAIPYNEVGMQEMPETHLVRHLFPNPAGSFVTIKSEGTEPISYQLYSMQGRLLMEGKFSDFVRLDLTDLMPGAYALRLTGRNETETKRLIIE